MLLDTKLWHLKTLFLYPISAARPSLFLEASSFPDYGRFGAAACGEVTGFLEGGREKELDGRGWVAIQIGFWMVIVRVILIMMSIELWQTAFKCQILLP